MRVARVRTTFTAVLATVALAGVLTGCGSSSDSASSGSSGTPTPSSSETTAAGGCADAEAVQSSLDALTKVDVKTDGVDSLTSALADVATALDATVQSASSALQPSIDQVKSAVADLQTATSGLNADNLSSKAPDITAALREVGTATTALTSSIAQDCPAS